MSNERPDDVETTSPETLNDEEGLPEPNDDE